MTLLFDDTKKLEKALGEEAAAPLIDVLNSMDARTLADLRAEVATKADIERVRVEISEVRGDVKRLDLQIKLLIGLAIVAIGMFSPVAAKLFTFIK